MFPVIIVLVWLRFLRASRSPEQARQPQACRPADCAQCQYASRYHQTSFLASLLQSLQTRRLHSLIWPSTKKKPGQNRAPNALAEMNRGLERGDAFDLAAYSSSFDSPPGEEAAKICPRRPPGSSTMSRRHLVRYCLCG